MGAPPPRNHRGRPSGPDPAGGSEPRAAPLPPDRPGGHPAHPRGLRVARRYDRGRHGCRRAPPARARIGDHRRRDAAHRGGRALRRRRAHARRRWHPRLLPASPAARARGVRAGRLPERSPPAQPGTGAALRHAGAGPRGRGDGPHRASGRLPRHRRAHPADGGRDPGHRPAPGPEQPPTPHGRIPAAPRHRPLSAGRASPRRAAEPARRAPGSGHRPAPRAHAVEPGLGAPPRGRRLPHRPGRDRGGGRVGRGDRSPSGPGRCHARPPRRAGHVLAPLLARPRHRRSAAPGPGAGPGDRGHDGDLPQPPRPGHHRPHRGGGGSRLGVDPLAAPLPSGGCGGPPGPGGQ